MTNPNLLSRDELVASWHDQATKILELKQMVAGLERALIQLHIIWESESVEAMNEAFAALGALIATARARQR